MPVPFPFQTSAVLLASELNSITELPINDKTASYTLVAGDAGEYVVMNSASATTITVPNSVFTASQIVYIVNKGTASTVVTAGAGTTVSTSGSLTVPANGCGRLLALSASAFIYEAGGITASSGALTLITAGTFTTATSVSLPTDTFSGTYRNYKVMFEVTAQTASVTLSLRIRSAGSDVTTARYFQQSPGVTSASTADSGVDNQTTSLSLGTSFSTSSFGQNILDLDVISPQIALPTKNLVGHYCFINTGASFTGRAFLGNFTPASGTQTYDSLSLISSVASSITGVYRVYGYADS